MAALGQAEVTTAVFRLRNGPCSKCGKGTGANDFFVSHQCVGLLQYTLTTRNGAVTCRACFHRRLRRDSLITLLAGWWSLGGLITTPIVLVRNLSAALRQSPGDAPSKALVEVVRVGLARAALDPSPQHPRTGPRRRRVASHALSAEEKASLRRFAKWVVGAALLLLLSPIAVSAWRQAHTKVWLVNGRAAPYVVTVNKKDYLLEPGRPLSIVHFGEEVSASLGSRAPVRCTFQHSMLKRLGGRTVFVVNPDGEAALVTEMARYGHGPYDAPLEPSRLVPSQTCHQFSDLDAAFTAFPKAKAVRQHESVSLKRVALQAQ
jgi:hypothetical protein